MATYRLSSRLAFVGLLLALLLPPRTHAEGLDKFDPTTPAITPTAEVGTLAASFAVTDTGSATYAIPLALPPGTHGMQPVLGLAYDSAAGNGPLGVGWSLAGTSSITRCAPNLAIDGRVGPVEFTSDDPLCLDGERLILLEGDAWQAGAVYATRRDDLARVRVIAGSACAGEVGFEVRTTDDRVHTYGCREDALVRMPRGILRWSLSRSIDRFGNSIDYRHDYEDIESSEGVSRVDHRLVEIDYGGHVGAPVLEHDTRVTLHWEPRPDASRGWFAGGQTASTLRLRGLAVYRDEALVRHWPLAYDGGEATGRSRLVAVRECAADAACKPATTFEWVDGELALDEVPEGAWSADNLLLPYLYDPYVPEGPEIARVTLDADGDGLTDILAAVGLAQHPPPEGRGWERWRSQPGAIGGVEPCGGNIDTPACVPGHYVVDEAPRIEPMPYALPEVEGRMHSMFAGDVDGDGRDDAIAGANHYMTWLGGTPGYWAIDQLVVVHGSDMHETHIPIGDASHPVFSFVAADFTGDTLTDVIVCQPSNDDELALEIGTWRVLPNTPGVGLELAALVDTGLRCGSYDKLLVLDHDGDGVASMLAVDTWSDDANDWLPTTKWGEYRALTFGPELDAFAWVETGLPVDVAQRWRASPTMVLNMILPDAAWPRYGASLGVDRLVDVQGDGLPDIVRYQLEIGDAPAQVDAIVDQLFAADPELEQGGLRLWVNDGLRFRDAGWLTPPGMFARKRFEEVSSSATLDWNGDGRLDLLMPNAQTDTWEAWVSEAGTLIPTPLPGAPPWIDESSAHPSALSGMDVDGDGLHDPVFWWSGQRWNIYRHAGESPDRIITITDGLGQRTAIEYASITDFEQPDLHEGASSCAWPASCAERPRIVVTKHHLDAGLADASVHTFEHRYAGARADRLERRGLGFASHTVTESVAGVVIGERRVEFANDHHDEGLAAFVRAGMPVRQLEQIHDPATGLHHVTLDEQTHAIVETSGASYRVVEASASSRTYELAHCFASACTLDEVLAAEPLTHAWSSVLSRDALGFALHERSHVALGGGEVEVIDVERTVAHDLDAWLIGRILDETVTAQGDDPVVRTHASGYDPETGALATELDQGNDAELALMSKYTRDAFGNVLTTMVADVLGEQRTTSFAYDARGRFPIAITNALGHITRLRWHDGLGVPHEVRDPNDVTQVVDVDGFGRPTGVRVFAGMLARGDDVTIEYLPASEGLAIRTSVLGHGQHTIIHDRLARPVRERWLGAEGLERERAIEFDVYGRVAVDRLPRFVGEPSNGHESWTYDALGRPLMHTRADGAFERWFYGGLSSEHRDFTGTRTVMHHDGAGRLIESERAPGLPEHERLCFDFGAFSTLVRVRPDCVPDDHGLLAPSEGEAPATIKRFEYDALGRVTASDDPSEGARSYAWTAFDDLRETFDASDRLVEYEHDALGRVITRIDDEGETAWTWDLDSVGTISVATTPRGVTTSHDFDAFARPIALTQELDGETFTVRFDYDGRNRVHAIHYPQVENLPAFAVRHQYGADGSLVGVVRLADDQPLWRIDEVDVEGRIVRESATNGTATTRTWNLDTGDLLGIRTLGPGQTLVQDLRYTWSEAGRLLAREDLRGDQREDFGYDALQRLTHAHAQRGEQVHERHFAYDTLGNLVHATDVGDYDYDEHGRLLAAGTTTHVWDAVGNLGIRTTPTRVDRFAWTSFDKVESIQPKGAAPTLFEYDAEQQRVRRHDLEAELETIYAFGFYERETTGEGERHRHQVFGRDRVVAEVELTIAEDAVASWQTRHLHDDHLGSPEAVTDEQGKVVQRLAFDAWGKPRDPNDWTLPDTFAAELIVNRGFTGHEGRPDAGLVNMGGRLYDPTIGRMANADPFVVVPELTIGWNRYAYVLDDPLSLTDPSGFSPEDGDSDSGAGNDGGGDGGVAGGPVDMGESESGQSTWSLAQAPGTLEFDIHTELNPTQDAGAASDAGPAVDGRDAGGEAGDSDESNTGRDVGLGLVDGTGNTGYMVMGGIASMASPWAGAAAVIGFWASGGNPASEIRQFVGQLIGSETLAADPSSGAYTASLITGEVVSGGVAGMARGLGKGLASAAVRSCASGACTGSAGFGARILGVALRTSCFVAGTPVAMADGSTQPIEAIEIGDEVACFDASGPATCIVSQTVAREAEVVLELELALADGERSTVIVTPEHPFFVAEFGRWLDAEDLRPGHTLASLGGEPVHVLGAVRREGSFAVYDFESLDAHDYYAGELEVLVHNGCSKLAQAIEAATGISRPTGHAAHHIVARNAAAADPARQVLKNHKISLDAAANGVYLPQNVIGRLMNTTAAYHPKVHTKAYYEQVNTRLGRTDTVEELLSELKAIGDELAAGTFSY